MKRWYVTMTWDDWPEGGSYGTVVEAETYTDAVRACEDEMCMARGWSTAPDEDDGGFCQELVDQWAVVDCFDLDEFIANHTRKTAA